MSSFDRRTLLLSGLALGACGFAPAYGPGGPAARLQGNVIIDAPDDRASFLLVQRLEERLGRTASGRYVLGVRLGVTEEGLAIGADGDTTRFHLLGRADYALREYQTGTVLTSGRVDTFSGYSTTGSTVATLAARRDAQARLMVLLADQITDRLVMSAAALPE